MSTNSSAQDFSSSRGSTAADLASHSALGNDTRHTDDIIPIPGTKSTKYLKENWESNSINVTAEDDKAIREIIKTIPITGNRYPDAFMQHCNV